jgi:hypothetical protein
MLHRLGSLRHTALRLSEMPERIKRDNFGLRSQLVFAEDPGMDFVTVHFDVLRGFDSETNLAPLGS